jgi:hypothetical protein
MDKFQKTAFTDYDCIQFCSITQMSHNEATDYVSPNYLLFLWSNQAGWDGRGM